VTHRFQGRAAGLGVILGAVLVLAAPAVPAQQVDDYSGMLGYLAETRVQDTAFSGADGAIAINMAAGDGNLQANQRAFARGGRAIAAVQQRQHQAGNVLAAPDHASASIGGAAFAGAAGLLSINQASGSGNAEANLVTAVLAERGIREASDGNLSFVAASAGEQRSDAQGVPATGTRSVAVESTALQGFNGVLQLNQVAGSGNAVDNQFALSVQGGP
jgi:hypothetical protein